MRTSTLLATTLFGAFCLSPTAVAQWGPSFGFSEIMESFVLLDLDRDGDLDVLGPRFNNSLNQPLLLVENAGDGTWGAAQPITSPEFIFGKIVAGDLTGDGVDDLLIAEGNGEISVIEVLGPNQLAAPVVVVSDTGSIFRAELGDLDGDGDLDIVATRFNLDVLVWYENEGALTFGAAQQIGPGVDGPNRLAVEDLDGDGDLDVLASITNVDRVIWYPNDGSGAFGLQRIVSTVADEPQGVAVADVNSDGIVDIVAASSGDREVSYFRGLGGGIFDTQFVVGVLGGTVTEVGVADINLDGLLDIYSATAIGSASNLRWFENITLGFGPAQTVPGTAGSGEAIRVMELDGDSDPDFVFGRGFTPQLTSIGTIYCTSNANSTGQNGQLEISGTARRETNAMTLNAFDLPPGTFGIFVASQFADPGVTPPGSEGILCLGVDIGLYQRLDEIGFTGVAGRFKLTIDLDEMRTSMGNVSAAAGQTWRFQAWHRDVQGGASTSSFTDAARVVLQ